MKRLFVGRHGRLESNGTFGAEGINDAHAMAEQLRESDLSRRSIILTSLADRALQTAGVIRADLDIPTILRSPFIGKVGKHPEPVEDLRSFIGDVLIACKIAHAELDAVIVTHHPLVEAVAHDGATFGKMYAVPEGWRNPLFNPEFAICLEQPDLW